MLPSTEGMTYKVKAIAEERGPRLIYGRIKYRINLYLSQITFKKFILGLQNIDDQSGV